jgi:hypothetical protein
VSVEGGAEGGEEEEEEVFFQSDEVWLARHQTGPFPFCQTVDDNWIVEVPGKE